MVERHREHDSEQRYLYAARAALDTAIAHVDELRLGALADKDNVDARALTANLTGRLMRLRDAGRQAVCFARLDDEAEETLYIGRSHIADTQQAALVIDWRARAAEPFYRATALDPMGCVLRRQFVLDGDEIVEIYDTDLTDPDSAGGIPDPLLAEINRARTGSMREIVATIQTEQDTVVRAPLDTTLVVQGGPGTGKTAVGLHRAAYLLFEHRERLHREGVLIVGPNRRFLAYISDVLPSLGERASRQIVPGDLGDIALPDSGPLDPELRRLAGDLRIATALRGFLAAQPTPPETDVRIRTDLGSATIEADSAAAHLASILAEHDRTGPARETWLSRIIADLLDQARRRSVGLAATASEFGAAVRRTDTFRSFAKQHWPELKAVPAVRAFWRTVTVDPTHLTDAGFTPSEIAVLQSRPPRQKLTEIDRPIIDEASWQSGKRFVDYGHVIVDEAQDLSPLALRMVARRARKHSLTILGDVAQCGADWAYVDWQLPLAALASDTTPIELAELTVGYRVPDEFIALANALLPAIAPDLAPTSSVRPAAQPAQWRHVAATELDALVAQTARDQTQRWSTTGVIVADSHLDHLQALLAQTAGCDVLTPRQAKGLEFDAVIIVEPALMHDPQTNWRPLFVALTRAVQHLTLLTTQPLPAPLARRLRPLRNAG